jgi:hypothetical protein
MRSWCGANVGGKIKKVIKKRRRSKRKWIDEKLILVAGSEFECLAGRDYEGHFS